jgi:hypothetical protein
MPTAVYDSSYLTLRNQAKVLYGFNQNNTAAVNAGLSVKREQPTLQSAAVILVRKQGGCFCAVENAGGNANSLPTGPCSCGR